MNNLCFLSALSIIPILTLPYCMSGLPRASQDFQWSPSDSLISAYTAEQGNLPARIVLIKIPERTELRQKNLFSVSDCKMFWHPQGDYLAVKVERFTKTKKSTFTGFELFSIRDKDIPMEVLELPNKNDKVMAFAWEPKGHRFAVVHGEGSRPSISFYSMRDEKGNKQSSVRLLGEGRGGRDGATGHSVPTPSHASNNVSDDIFLF